jgi:signal transduction histidine kinase
VPRCDVMLLHGCAELRVSVRDYGRGLPSDQTVGVGLAAMRERAAELGGRCEWHSIPGRGTLVDCSLPLAEVQR